MASIALASAGAAVLAPTPALAAPEHTVSKDIGKTLQAAQTALHDRKYSDAIAKLKDADGFGKKTPWDQHVINVLAAGAYQNAKQYPDAIKRYEALLGDGFTSEADQQKFVRALAGLYYGQQNYDKALEYANKAVKGGYGDDGTRTIVLNSTYQKKDYKATQKLLEDQVNSAVRSGATPKQDTLELLRDAYAKQGDKEGQTRVLEKLVTYYPKPLYWETLLYELTKTELPDAARLQLYSLMIEVGVLKDNKDYTEAAQIALDEGAPGESQQIIEKGFENKLFADQRSQDKNKRLLDKAKQDAATLQAGLPASIKEAEAAPTGAEYVKLGYGYIGFKQYDKAIDALNKAVAKGGLKDGGAEAHLLLGVAQYKAGHRDEASKSFKQVKGDPLLERIANLWSLHAKQPESVAKR